MKLFRFSATFKNSNYRQVTKTGIVFADTIEDAKAKVRDEYDVDAVVWESENNIIED